MFNLYLLRTIGARWVIYRTINTLPPMCKRAVILIKYDKLSYHQAAKIMGISPAVAQLLYERGKEHCIKKCVEYYERH